MVRPVTMCATSVYVLAGVLGLVSTGRAQPLTIVSPAGSENVEGDILFLPANSPYPDVPPLPPLLDGWRGQELHPASMFDAVAGPLLLTGMAWRPDESVDEAISTDWEVTVNLSTTNVGALSTMFADNIGAAGVTEVFSGALQLATDGVPQGTGLPHDFDYVVEFETPFLYDPRQGDLLVEWLFPSTYDGLLHSIWVDAVSTSEFVFGLSAAADEAFGPPEPGLFVTQFTFIPEPSTCSIAVVAMVGGLCASRRRD